MRDEPGALKCRHQSLVVNLRLKEIEKNEYSRKDCREGQYPFILPADISEQTCAGCKERIPQPRFTHCAEWRTLQRYPEKNDKARKNYGRCPECQQGRLSVVKRRSGRSRNRQQYCQVGKINEDIPRGLAPRGISSRRNRENKNTLALLQITGGEGNSDIALVLI